MYKQGYRPQVSTKDLSLAFLDRLKEGYGSKLAHLWHGHFPVLDWWNLRGTNGDMEYGVRVVPHLTHIQHREGQENSGSLKSHADSKTIGQGQLK